MGGTRRGQGWTRRGALSALTGLGMPAAGAVGGRFASELYAFVDTATESPVLRLTSPAQSSGLPSYRSSAFTRRRASLVYHSDRTGKPQAFQMDLGTGESVQLTDAEALDGSSICLLPGENTFCCFDGASLSVTSLAGGRNRTIYRVPEGWSRDRGFSISVDGRYATFIETRGSVSRLRLLPLTRGSASTVVEAAAVLRDPVPRPRQAAILYHREDDSLWLVNYNGRDNRPLKLAPGGIGPAYWSADGRSIFYLSFPEPRRSLNSIRENTPATNSDRLIGLTSQFANFSPNGDASVFVGASSSKASPCVLLLLSVTRRELTLCEHRASDPADVAPVFSPDSQRVYFHSDQHGKPAIYSLRVDRLVEKTQT